jgi:hypothetical protein
MAVAVLAALLGARAGTDLVLRTAVTGSGVLSTLLVFLQRRTSHALEQEVAIRKEAEQASRAAELAKSDFLANISHEIRTPMNAVVGLAELLLRSGADPQQQGRLEALSSSAEALLALVDNILDLSRMEAGRFNLDEVDFRVAEVVEGVVARLSPQARAKGLDIRLELAEGLPAVLRGDPGRLRQVLHNLVDNAVKFTAAGSILVRAEPEESGGQAWLRILVSDTGTGVGEEEIEHIFSPFSQADSSAARLFGGAGIGLTLARRLVELQGGSIHVDSIRGLGSTFWFRLPAAPARGEVPAAPAPARLDLHGAHALVVEDNPVNQQVALGQLAALGISADTAADGASALRAMGDRVYDVVLMDCQLPGLDGYETTRRLRRLETNGHRTPVVAVTAHALKGERERCLAAGMDDYLAKPLRLGALGGVLGRLLTRADGRAEGRTPDRPVLDPSQIEMLRLLERRAGQPLLGALAQSFPRQAGQYLDQMRAASREGDAKSLYFAAHSLKGGAANIGALELARLCLEIEEPAQQSETCGCAEILDRVEQESQKVVRELQRLAETSAPP